MTGIEVQRSAMTRAAAVARSARAQRAGVSDIWCTDSDKRPRWSYRVPTVTANTLPWDVVPPLRSATATSLRVIEAERCTAANFSCCPKTRKRHCGKYHAVHSPWPGLTVDYVAERVPAGEIVPLRFWRSARHQDIILVSHESAALYEELTGSAAGVTYHPAAEERLQDARPGRVECSNPQPAAARKDLTTPSPHAPQNSGAHGRAPGECISCGEPGRLYAGGWLCDRHAPRRTGRWPGP